jgi:hypothetical protein
LQGNPEAVKAAYDKQIAASQQQSKEMKDFLMGQKGQSLQYWGPLQHMFDASYGTEGIQAPQMPGAASAAPAGKPPGPLQNMYAPDPGKGRR